MVEISTILGKPHKIYIKLNNPYSQRDNTNLIYNKKFKNARDTR